MSHPRDHVRTAWCELLLALLEDAKHQQLLDIERRNAQQALGLLSDAFELDPARAAELLAKLSKRLPAAKPRRKP